MNARVTARRTGRNFGYVGEVRAMNGRVIAATDETYPTRASAENAADKLAQNMGRAVVPYIGQVR